MINKDFNIMNEGIRPRIYIPWKIIQSADLPEVGKFSLHAIK